MPWRAWADYLTAAPGDQFIFGGLVMAKKKAMQAAAPDRREGAASRDAVADFVDFSGWLVKSSGELANRGPESIA